MALAARMQAAAIRLLTKFDESPSDNRRIKLLRQGLPYWDDNLDEQVPGTFESFDLVGVTVNYSDTLVDGTTILAGDMKAIVTSSVAPKANDKVSVDGVQWSIVGEPKSQYTGVAIVYILQLRK